MCYLTVDAETEGVLSISALQSMFEKFCATIYSEMQFSFAPINPGCAQQKALWLWTSLHQNVRSPHWPLGVTGETTARELKGNCEDLENRSCCNNSRGIGLPEGHEGAEILVDQLWKKSFITPPGHGAPDAEGQAMEKESDHTPAALSIDGLQIIMPAK